MDVIAIRLDPDRLSNPLTDLRYIVPDLMIERANGVLSDDGWDYAGAPPYMVMWLRASDLQQGLRCVLEVIEGPPVMENDLRQGAVVAIQRGDAYQVVYPPEFTGRFDPWAA